VCRNDEQINDERSRQMGGGIGNKRVSGETINDLPG
jgi:hypothetical protein